MKKLWNFLRSMRFGMCLLCLILLCSLPGSMIQQGNEATFYLENYSWGQLLLDLKLDHIFSSWYFLALLGFLCLNLFLCSVLRGWNIRKLHKGMGARLSAMPLTECEAETSAQLEALFRKQGLRLVEEREGRRIYKKNALGFYGSFLTHLGLLLSLLFAAAGLSFALVEDHNLVVGESFTLSDSTKLELLDFQTEDAQGKVDYVSSIRVTDRKGNVSEVREIRVNEPFSFGGHKYYQQNYGDLGAVAVNYNGITQNVKVDGQMFLTLDGTTGLAIYGLYSMGEAAPGHEDHNHGGSFYAIGLYEGGPEPTMGMAKEGDVFRISDVEYSFLPRLPFSGIRVKTLPGWTLFGLYASFALLTFDLYVCFFMNPVYVVMTPEGYGLFSPKKDVLLQRKMEKILQKSEEDEV